MGPYPIFLNKNGLVYHFPKYPQQALISTEEVNKPTCTPIHAKETNPLAAEARSKVFKHLYGPLLFFSTGPGFFSTMLFMRLFFFFSTLMTKRHKLIDLCIGLYHASPNIKLPETRTRSTSNLSHVMRKPV